MGLGYLLSLTALVLAKGHLVRGEAPVECVNTGPRCLSSCIDRPNGDYQSCLSCHEFISCSNSIRYRMPCPSRLVWDDNTKRCSWRSQTCNCQKPEPIDGQWSEFQPWSKCLTSCGGGLRFRGRNCTNPAPQYGGADCEGESFEFAACSDWACPDCSRECPPGGKLDTECSLCLCTGDVVKGKVTDETTSHAMSGVLIFVMGREWSPNAVTDKNGEFQLNGICREGMQLKAIMDGYEKQTMDVPASGDVAIIMTSQ